MSIITCRGCGQPLAAGVATCGVCGVRVPEAQHAVIAGGDGASMGTVTPAQPSVPVVPAAPVTPVAPPAPAVQYAATPAVPTAEVPTAPVPTAPAPTAPAVDEQAQRAMIEQTYAELSSRQTQRNSNRRLVLMSVSALLLTLIARVAFSAVTSEPKPEGELVAQLPVTPEKGGSTKFDGDGKIKVPKGAVSKPETITVRRTVVRDRIRATSPAGGSIIIPAGAQNVYIFGPTALVFLRPVTIVLPAPPPPNQGIVFISANGGIQFINVDPRSRTVTIRVNSFDFARGPSVFVN